MRLLLVEDDRQVARQLLQTLKRAGYVVDVAYDGEEGEYLGANETYDTVILDIGLPIVDGLTVLRNWRASQLSMPVLILTARDTWREKVDGLRAGADDYLAKPFEMEELLARVEALIRRSAGHGSPTLEWGPISLDISRQQANQDGQPVELTPLEYRMLAYLMRYPEKIVSKTELTEHLYDQDFDRDSNVIEVLVTRLRKKFGAELIKTHRGRGYQLVKADDTG